MPTDKATDILNVLNNLKYRIEITKRARIKASARLRKKHIGFERIIHFYSILILILTVWFLGSGEFNKNDESTKFLLILSLTITFLSMYLNMRNYKERAGNFETNYQNLDILLNRIDRKIIDIQKIDVDDIKQFQREYEKLLIDKENHLDIDFKKALEDYNRSQARKNKKSTEEDVDDNRGTQQTFFHKAKELFKSIQWIDLIKYICLMFFPIIIIMILFGFEFLIEKLF